MNLLYPPVWVVLLLIPITAVLLFVAFLPQMKNTAVEYIGYAVSAYSLTIVIINFTRIIKTVTDKLLSFKPIKAITENRVFKMFIGDMSFRGEFSLYQGLTANILYAAFRAITAVIYHSLWFGVIAIYYILLSLIRIVLAVAINKRGKYQQASVAREIYELKVYRLTGFLMLLLNIGMTGVTVMMIKQNMYYEYPGFIIYLSAAYTFYVTIMAIVNIVKFRRLKSPILSASKAISLTGALMSVLALQTSMIARFGGDDTSFRLMMNSATGAAVCITTVLMALIIIIRGTKKIYKRRELWKN